MFSYHFTIISCLKYTVNSYFHLIQRKSLSRNDSKLTVPDLYMVDLVHDSMQGHEIKKILIPGAPPFGSATDSWGFAAGWELMELVRRGLVSPPARTPVGFNFLLFHKKKSGKFLNSLPLCKRRSLIQEVLDLIF